ncbi:MAG TPA: type III-B CRISPR module-associated protein Cmr3 [Anaerolineae bacterium]|nr:type III-B CRISPR module-associated protein Cmr3 [Anaerolineae bacterium]
MMRVFLEPLDVWLFRDGRPFDALSDHRAQSIFPPLPTVAQGVIRSAHLAYRGVPISDYIYGHAPHVEAEIGPPGKHPPFTVRGPFIARMDEARDAVIRYLPRPADASLSDGDWMAPGPLSDGPFANNLPDSVRLLWTSFRPQKDEEAAKWVSEATLGTYLAKGQVARGKVYQDADLFVRESRFGIGLDSTLRRPHEGALYEIEFVRAKEGVGLEIEVQGLDMNCWPQSGLLKIGGEGRAAMVQKLQDRPSMGVGQMPDPEDQGRVRFKLYFATPAYFDDGWRPSDWGRFFNGSAPQLAAAAVERPLVLGGIDLAKAEKGGGQPHKPAKRYVPAGSVYFFEGDDTTTLKSEHVTDFGATIGFGQIFVGRW